MAWGKVTEALGFLFVLSPGSSALGKVTDIS